MKRQLLIGTFSLVLFLYIVQELFFSSKPEASSSLRKSPFSYRKKLYAHISSRGLIKSFTDIHTTSEEAVQDAVEAELSELQDMGVELDVLDQVRFNMKQRTKLPESVVIKPTDGNPTEDVEDNEITKDVEENKVEDVAEEERSFNRSLSRQFRVRNPDPEDMQRLKSEKQVAAEQISDPLESSVFCKREVFLTILVISQPSNVKRRKYIRDSWAHSYEDDYRKMKGSQPFPNGKTYIPSDVVKMVFVIGQAKDAKSGEIEALEKEMQLNKDIVLGEMLEDYRNLTLKTKMGLKWAYYECKTSYVLKTDDDVFVNPVVLVEWLKEIPTNNLYTGWCNSNSPVIRNKKSKWYVSYEDYKGSKFPSYCLGGGYLMSSDVLAAVVKLSLGRFLFPMEDLYVGLMVKELEGVQPRDERKHFNLVYYGRTPKDCDLNSLFLLHRVLGENLVKHMKQARNALENC